MRTAEEYIKEHITKYVSFPAGEWLEVKIRNAINEARRECIDECAEAVTARISTDDFDGSKDAIVNKQSILKLKEQIK